MITAIAHSSAIVEKNPSIDNGTATCSCSMLATVTEKTIEETVIIILAFVSAINDICTIFVRLRRRILSTAVEDFPSFVSSNFSNKVSGDSKFLTSHCSLIFLQYNF